MRGELPSKWTPHSNSSLSELFKYFSSHPPTPAYRELQYCSGLMPHKYGSYLALGHGEWACTRPLASVLESVNHVTATNGLRFTENVFSTCLGTLISDDAKHDVSGTRPHNAKQLRHDHIGIAKGVKKVRIAETSI